MDETSREQTDRSAPQPSPPRRIRVPAPVIYTLTILGLGVLVLTLLPKVISVHKDVVTRFQESLVEVKGNHGDVLEIATYKSTAYFSESDKLDTSVLGIQVPLGTTEAFLFVPVTYRFHVLLSDHWRMAITPETVTVIAPEIRPSLPPAPDISAMEVRTERGWARFNKEEVEDRVKSMVTGQLNIRAYGMARSQIIRDAARHSVESSLKNYIPWLSDECRKKAFTVKFVDEVAEESRRTRAETEPPGYRR